VALTQTRLASAVVERAQLSKADAKRALIPLDEIVLAELGDTQKGADRRSGAVDGARQAGAEAAPGSQPVTGEQITIAARPASAALRARPLARAKEARPSVQNARRRLAA